jgi:hypothetical protein
MLSFAINRIEADMTNESNHAMIQAKICGRPAARSVEHNNEGAETAALPVDSRKQCGRTE